MLATQALGCFEFVFRDVVLARPSAPVGPQSAGVVVQTLQSALQALNARTGREELLSGVVSAPLQDLAAPFPQTEVIEAKHAFEETPVRTVQERSQRLLAGRNPRVISSEEGVPVTLPAAHFQDLGRYLQGGPDAHAAVLVDEVEGGT